MQEQGVGEIGLFTHLSKLCRSLYVPFQATKRYTVVFKVCAIELPAATLQIRHCEPRNVVDALWCLFDGVLVVLRLAAFELPMQLAADGCRRIMNG